MFAKSSKIISKLPNIKEYDNDVKYYFLKIMTIYKLWVSNNTEIRQE